MSSFVRRIGPLPQEWKGSYVFLEEEDSWYDQDIKRDPGKDLRGCFDSWRPGTDPAERELALSVMKKVFHYYPEKRPTATELLRGESFNALLKMYGA
jgi:hypothetical protein